MKRSGKKLKQYKNNFHTKAQEALRWLKRLEAGDLPQELRPYPANHFQQVTVDAVCEAVDECKTPSERDLYVLNAISEA